MSAAAKHFWRMTTGKVMEGVFGTVTSLEKVIGVMLMEEAINKPTGLSSAQVVRDLQKHFNPSELFAPWIQLEKSARERENHNQRKRRREKTIQVKIGHGGTLDPLATGVLITGIGKGTKALQDFLLCTKVYETVVLFGTSTDTYDRVGKVLKRAPYEHVTKEMVEKALEQFRGKFMQLPPLFSALKMNGKPLYEYAREGKDIPREIERRPVEVLELEMVEWMEGGTHSHEAPTDEAGYAEVNLANRMWKQEGVIPGGGKDRGASTRDNGRQKSQSPPPLSECVETKKEEPTEDHGEATKSSTNHGEDLTSKGKGEEAASLENAKPTKLEEGREQPIKRSKSQEDLEALANFENKKRKLSEDQDDLVLERPPSKSRKPVISSQDATMSGGLPPPSPSLQPSIEESPVLPLSTKGPPAVRLKMTVTSGFYVRSLCHDLGAAVGSAALMAELERTRQGEFELGVNVLEYTDLEKGEKVWGSKVEGMLDEWEERHKPKGVEATSGKADVEREERDDRVASSGFIGRQEIA
jgi:tRNA pseudouridine55 synthase